MYGAVDFYRACKAEGVKPVIGCEVYVAPRTRFDKQHEFDAEARHLVLLCENEEGYRNLSYMVSKALYRGLLHQAPHRPGAAARSTPRDSSALSGVSCWGDPPAGSRNGEYDNAKAYALDTARRSLARTASIWSFRTTASARQAVVTRGSAAHPPRRRACPSSCTNDAHYLTKADAYAHDVLLCIQTGKTVDDREPDALRAAGTSTSSSTEEMEALFAQLPGRDREHGEDRGDVQPGVRPSASTTCREFKLPEG